MVAAFEVERTCYGEYMKNFLKPTKVTFVALVLVVVVNGVLLLLAVFYGVGAYFMISQALWLYGIISQLGVDVIGTGGYIPAPNFLGWTLIAIGTLTTLVIYYLLASLISKYYYQRKQAWKQQGNW